MRASSARSAEGAVLLLALREKGRARRRFVPRLTARRRNAPHSHATPIPTPGTPLGLSSRRLEQSAPRTLDRPVRRAAVRAHRAPSISLPPSTRRWLKSAPRSIRSPAIPQAPTFDNTIGALERSGKALDRVASVFFNLAGADSNDALEQIERDIAPILARERNAIFLNDALFAAHRGAPSRRRAALALDAEAARALDRYRIAFVRAGAGLAPEKKARLAAIGERLATLGAEFGQNVLADEKAFAMILDGPDDLAGLPQSFLAAAARTAAERGLPGKHAVTLSRSSYEPFLQFSARRDLREKAFRAFRRARRERRRARQRRDHERDRAAARRARARCWAFPATPIFASPMRWPRRPRRRSACSGGSGRRRARRPLREAEALQADDRRRGRQFRAQALGLALLRGKAPQGALRHRRERAQAISAAGRDDRCGLRRRPSPVRPFLRRAPRHRALSRGRARLDGGGARRRADRSVHRRLFRSGLEAQRRLDEFVPRSAEARRQGPADHRQRDEFRARRGGRGVPPRHGRGAHIVPRIRPRAARHALRRHLSPARGNERGDAISSNFPRSCTSTGSSAPRRCAASPGITRPASRCRRR